MLLEHDIHLEDFGGDVQAVCISALKVCHSVTPSIFYTVYYCVVLIFTDHIRNNLQNCVASLFLKI